MLERAVEAVQMCHSNDSVVIAKCALQAALRSSEDIEELLQAQQPRRPRAQPVVEATASA
jgi:hypothetical protein